MDQENKLDLTEVLNNTSEIALFVFNEEGNVNSANKAALDILDIKSDKELKSLNIQNIFDFRISEIKNELVESGEISKEINIITKNKTFIPTKTVFSKTANKVTAISTILSEALSQESSIKKLIQSLDKVSKILNSNLELDDTLELILNDLRSIINYDKAVIMFLEGDSLNLKASRNLIDSIKQYERSLPGGSSLLNKLIKSNKANTDTITDISLNSAIMDLMKGLGLKLNLPFSYIASPLTIRETLFGIIVLIKEQENFFSNADLKIAETFTSSAAYSVKDAELSNVFKMQLKILKENVIERTKALEVIKEQNLKILEADKLKNEFIANISHELRTRLNAIIGFSEALKLKIFGSLNEKQEEYIDDIHTSGIHLLGMINDLLDLSKIEAKEMQIYKKQFTVYPAICEVLNVIRAIVDKKKITIEILCKNKSVEIYADYRKFQQVLYNLLSNAAKFSPERDKIEIGIDKIDNNLRIYVKDNGIGIDPKYHEKIFHKFQQVDNSYARRQGSTGLGLTITKELVEMHSGKIWVESEPEKGATFYFTLPIIEVDGQDNKNKAENLINE
ncbi:MAG: hypothetical protein A2104_06820 [Candidatus Melainabacteria bacterium GWF2_32_7]|nr:MAG: hypothetical protein A2104_06820 [Candidatus Melainabacteria bacterium GWF2_32_7]